MLMLINIKQTALKFGPTWTKNFILKQNGKDKLDYGFECISFSCLIQLAIYILL